MKVPQNTILKMGRGQYLVKSRSSESWYCVDLEAVDREDPVGGCTCEAYRFRKSCFHIQLAHTLESQGDTIGAKETPV
jgi:hypothetical protein